MLSKAPEMLNVPRRFRRRITNLGLSLLALLVTWHLFLAPDSTIRLAVHFNTARLLNGIRGGLTNRDKWLQQPASHPLDLREDVGYLIKTGYGTRHRVPEQLEAFRAAGDFLGDEGRSFLVVGDWTSVNETDAALLGVDVLDAVRMVMEDKISPAQRSHPRFSKYVGLQEAVAGGDEALANHLGKSFGWELDALKFIMGMELLHERLPGKKWYVILDDDTFVIKPSLELFLSHLDPEKPHYIGNAVGDFRGRFGHGGSGVVVSGAAMRKLFARPDVVRAAYARSLDETWGDKLVATTVQKLGIYIDEKHNHYFNGEPPEITRIAADRFCSPLVSFHGLRKPGAMARVGRVLAPAVEHPVLWGEVWRHFAPYPVAALGEQPAQKGQDHVGPPDEKVREWRGVESAEECREKCKGDCLAWTYVESHERCLASPWMVIGAEGAEAKVSGVNWKLVEKLVLECS